MDALVAAWWPWAEQAGRDALAALLVWAQPAVGVVAGWIMSLVGTILLGIAKLVGRHIQVNQTMILAFLLSLALGKSIDIARWQLWTGIKAYAAWVKGWVVSGWWLATLLFWWSVRFVVVAVITVLAYPWVEHVLRVVFPAEGGTDLLTNL